MTRYRIEEEDDTPDFLIVIQLALAILFLPIGIIWGIVKLINYFSDKSKENALKEHSLHNAKMIELQNLAELKKQGLLSEEEYETRRQKIIKHI